MKVEFPAKLAPLFHPARFKDVHGGRDSGKSWGVAMALVEIASTRKLLIVCARETRESIQDSVHRSLVLQIERLGLADQYLIERQRITHKGTGSEFIFRGLLNPDAMKSLEGADICWIEEAQTMSEESWRKVVPTVRRPGSEIWLTWNPELETDPTWKHCVTDPEPDMVHIVMNYVDNPWASEVLHAQREKLRRDDPDEFAHVYMGQPRRAISGAVYANELRLMDEQGRVRELSHQKGVPVLTGWDLGEGDFTAIWFVQAVQGQFRFLNYVEDRHKPMAFYLAELKRLAAQHGYDYGRAYFPWDASSKMLVNSFEESMRRDGLDVKVNARMSRETGIDRMRGMLGSAWFDVRNCEDGLKRLRYYRYGITTKVDPATGEYVTTREPIHDDNSHGADAARTLAMGYVEPKLFIPKVQPQKRRMLTTWS